MPLTSAILRSTAALESLVPEWTELWEAAPDARPFQHPAWLLPWWHQFGQPDLRVVTLRKAGSGRLVGLVPLYIYQKPGVEQQPGNQQQPDRNQRPGIDRQAGIDGQAGGSGGRRGAGERQLLLLGAGTSDYLDGIVLAECSAEELAQALRPLWAEVAWDVAYLTQLPPESRLVRALELLGSEGVETFAGEPTSRCPARTISELPAKVRREVLFCRNAAIAHGRLELNRASGNDLHGAFDDLVVTHTARWASRGEPGVLADPAVLRWHREALPLLERAGLLALLTLRLEGRPIATMYSLLDPPTRARRTQYLYLMGFDAEREELQPGRLLMAYTLEWAAEQGVPWIDMLRGEESYKQFWHVERVATRGFAVRRA